MCCFFLALLLLGPRVVGALWWLFQPIYWQVAFNGWPIVWWLWPLAGIVFLPWLTLMYVLVAPGGITGLDWLWLGLALVADVAWYTGGVGRKRVPGYVGY